ncbi:hypothetical protein ABZ369_08285 [Streptomyces sp. NPDC005918]
MPSGSIKVSGAAAPRRAYCTGVPWTADFHAAMAASTHQQTT